jgi:hypothetical protein
VCGYTRLPVLQRVCSEVSPGLMSYNKKHRSFDFRQSSDMSGSGSPNGDEIRKEKGK